MNPLGVAATSEESGGAADVDDVIEVDDRAEVVDEVEFEDLGACDPLADALQAESVMTTRLIPIQRPRDPRSL
jgi:hypothetical protein